MRRSPTSCAASSTTCSRRCTPRAASGSPRRRSGARERLAVVDVEDEPLVVINPEIIERDGQGEGRGRLPLDPRRLRRRRARRKQRRSCARMDIDGKHVRSRGDRAARALPAARDRSPHGKLFLDHLSLLKRARRSRSGTRRRTSIPSFIRRVALETPEDRERHSIRRRSSSVRVLFWGTPEFAAPPLRALLGEGFDVVGVVTQPDKPVGRSRSQLDAVAGEGGRARGRASGAAAGEAARRRVHRADARARSRTSRVVVAYGHILPKAVIDLPRLGTLNIHASLLPPLRGAAPIQAAIRTGSRETGVTIMQMVPALDAGPDLHHAAHADRRRRDLRRARTAARASSARWR